MSVHMCTTYTMYSNQCVLLRHYYHIQLTHPGRPTHSSSVASLPSHKSA